MAKDIRILIIDDDHVLLDLISRRLERMGCKPDRASDGEDALGMIAKDNYDLVVTDIYMPKVTGLDLLEEIKKRDPHTQVIVITGGATLDLALEALDKGAFAYLSKPFDHLRIFDHTVKQALRFRKLLLTALQRQESDSEDAASAAEKKNQPDPKEQLAEELLQILQHLPDAVLIVDKHGEVLLANPPAKRIMATGWNVKSLPKEMYQAALKGRMNGGASIEVDGATYKMRAVEMNVKEGAGNVFFFMQSVPQNQATLAPDLHEPIKLLKTCLAWLYGQRLREKEFRVLRKMAEQVTLMEHLQEPNSGPRLGVTGLLTRGVQEWSEISHVLQDGPQ